MNDDSGTGSGTDTAPRPLRSSLRHYLRRIYAIFWHELSLDPKVRASPYAPPAPDQVRLSAWKKFVVRARRIYFLVVHVVACVGLYYCLLGRANPLTISWTASLTAMAIIGAGAGAHRLWSHNSYKASWQMRLILIVFQTLSVQYSAYNWARDHRLHHKYSDTDADPHNAKRGFFFSHIGWLMVLRHPRCNESVKSVWTEDLKRDKIVVFQDTHYFRMCLAIAYVIPTLVPWYFWNENLWIAHTIAVHLRHALSLHATFLINSAAHMYGVRPYDRSIEPTENLLVSFFSGGDGWHNYHHTFPWDYRNAEYWDYKYNLSTLFVDLCASVGWAYDLKTVPPDVVAKRAIRTGDGTYSPRDDDDDGGGGHQFRAKLFENAP